VTVAVAAEVADAVPYLFFADTCERSVEPTSAACTTYDDPVAPEIGPQAAPVLSQRNH
jgi:hypothetical protein